MTTLPDHELLHINGGLRFDLPPWHPQPLIDDAFWMQRAIWEHLYGS